MNNNNKNKSPNSKTASDSTSNQDTELILSAPILPGFHSIQAHFKDGVPLSVTQYHRGMEPAMDCMKGMLMWENLDGFSIYSPDDHMDACELHGTTNETSALIPPEKMLSKDSCLPSQADLIEYTQSVKAILGASVTPLTFAVHHPDASSAGHSNTTTVARCMIMNASDEDLEHVYFTDGVVNGCWVQSWFMDSAAVSKELMDRYLDFHKPLTNGWPLDHEHYMEVLADRMAVLRPWGVIRMLEIVGAHADLGESLDQVEQRLLEARSDELIMFTSLMLDVVKESIYIGPPYNSELIAEWVVIEHAERIAEMYRETFPQ